MAFYGMKYFVVAGEASGDLHGGHLMEALKQKDTNAQFRFLGGDCMAQAAGCEPIVHFNDMAFMGFIAVISHLSDIKRNATTVKSELLRFRPEKLILIDYPGFNLRLAKWVKRHLPATEVIYYISPKLWAWKSYRIGSIRKYVDRMFTIFPFETKWFAQRGYSVQYVGNPTVDAVTTYKLSHAKPNIEASKPIVALLPGSRLQEINNCLPQMVKLADLFPEYQFVVAAAPSVDTKVYSQIAGNSVDVIQSSTYDLLSHAEAAVVNSGTATLETALLGVPQVVVYHVAGGAFARLLKRLILKIPFVSLVNIIAEQEVVKELLADQFTVENMANELNNLLKNQQYRSEIRKKYAEIAAELGGAGAAEKCARLILS